MRDWAALAEQDPERFLRDPATGRAVPILAGGKGGAGGSTTIVEAPKPTEQEIEIQKQQLAQLTIQTDIAKQQAEAFPEFLDLQKTQVRIAQRALELQEKGLEASAALQRAEVEAAQRGLDLQTALEPFVLQSLRLVKEPTGNLRRMTEDEFVATLSPTEQIANTNLKLALERESKALRGELPLSAASQQAKQREFLAFKESMGRGGNPITGETPETAVATTTPGIQALEEFRKRFALVEEAERRGELSQGSQLVLQRLGMTSDIGRQNRVGMLESFARPAPDFPAISAPGFALLNPDYAGALQPYQFTRQQQLQANIATAQSAAANRAARAQEQAGLFAGLGSLAGGLISAGGSIYGASLLKGAGAGLIGSSRRLKKDIRRATAREERQALQMVRDLDTYTYRYKDEPAGAPRRIGLMADEAPRAIVTPDRGGLDVGRTVGMLIAATRALARERRTG